MLKPFYKLFFMSPRAKCVAKGHGESETLDVMESEKYPDRDFIFRVILKQCKECGAVYTKEELGFRGGVEAFLKR